MNHPGSSCRHHCYPDSSLPWPLTKARGIVCLACIVLSSLLLFRDFWASRFDMVVGNIGDTRLIVAFLEHWTRVATAGEAWRSPTFFYPIEGVLGLSDGFFLYAIPYVPLRLMGIEPYLSLELTLIGIHMLGFLSFLVMARNGLRLTFSSSLASACIFSTLHATSISIQNVQNLATAFYPLLLLCAAMCVRHMPSRRAVPWALGAGALLPLILLTSFYYGWFMGLWAIAATSLGLAALLVLSPKRTAVLDWVFANATVLLAWLSASVLCLLPVLWLYLPALRLTSPFPFSIDHLPGLVDLIYLGGGDFVWGWAGTSLASTDLHNPGAYAPGLTLALLIFFLLVTAWSWSGLKWPLCPSPVRGFVRLVGLATFVVLVLPIRFGSFTAWHWVAQVLPGSEGIRFPFRLLMAMGFFVTTIAAVGLSLLDRAIAAVRSHGGRVAARAGYILLLVLLVAEQLDRSPTHHLSRSAENAFLNAVPAPPAACRIMAVSKGREGYFAQIDAMQLSSRLGVPTVNGYTGAHPLSWDLDDTHGWDYMERVHDWASRFNLENICIFDFAQNDWSMLRDLDIPKEVCRSSLHPNNDDEQLTLAESLAKQGCLTARWRDLASIHRALNRYFQDHGTYPVSQGMSGRFSRWGYSGPEWIPGLAPDYIDGLPSDPRGNDNPSNQYLYISDGKNYKLIAHSPPDIKGVARQYPELLDPARPGFAYGYWTANASLW